MKRYIYIDEAGDVGVGVTAPTDADKDAIDNGILQVIVVDIALGTINEINADESLSVLQPAILADPEDEDGQPYHYIP
jgi:hypothetical protein